MDNNGQFPVKKDNVNVSSVRFVLVILGMCVIMLGVAAVMAVAQQNAARRIGYQRHWVQTMDGARLGVKNETEFATQEFHRHQCLESVQKRIRLGFIPHFQKYPGGVALVGVALNEILEDNMVWRATVVLLADLGINPSIACYITQPSRSRRVDPKAPKCDYKKIINVVKDKGLVLIHAGGNWGDVYRSTQVKKLAWVKKLSADAQKHGFGIVQLPQSIFYRNSSNLEEDVEVLDEIDPEVFTLMVRSEASYEFAKENFSSIPVKLMPDLAFALGSLSSHDEPTFDVLIHKRPDNGSTEAFEEFHLWVDQRFKAVNLTYELKDWSVGDENRDPHGAGETTIPVFSEIGTAGANMIMSRGKVVITNLLHGSIMSTLIGRHLFYIDTQEEKVGNVRENSLSESQHCTPENLHAHSMDSFKEAVEAAIDLILAEGDEFVYN